jgi:YebC/PmpR family DNA-binding regulatory protein
VRYEAVNYEGYAHGGVAVIVETLTDNRNRTGAEIRNLFSRNGGSIAEPGAVSWQFERKGVVSLDKAIDEDRIMEIGMEAGAEDLADEGERWVLTTAPSDLGAVRDALEAGGVSVQSAELTLVPTTTTVVSDETEARKILRLLDAIEDHDDVQAVHANYDIADEVLAGYAG